MSLEDCKEFVNDLFEFLHGKKLYEDSGGIVDEENDIVEFECRNEKAELSKLPLDTLRRALGAGNKKETSLGTPENLKECNTQDSSYRVFPGTSIPTKVEIKLSKSSEQKLFELGCYLTDAHKVKKQKHVEKTEESKTQESGGVGNDQNNSLVGTLKSDPQELSHNKNLMQQINSLNAMKNIHFRSSKLCPPQFCKYKKRFISVRVGKRELKQAYIQEMKLQMEKDYNEGIEENNPKQLENESTPKSFEKKSKRYSLSTLYRKKKLKHHRKSKDDITGISHAIKKQKKLDHLPESKKFLKEVKVRKVQNKHVQTNNKDMMNNLTHLLRKHKRLQEKNKSLSESLSCLLTNFDTTPSIQINNNSSNKVIESSSIPIKNLHKIFQKLEYKSLHK